MTKDEAYALLTEGFQRWPPTKKRLVYVAGPYTNPDPVENTNIAIRAGLELYGTRKCAVVIPHLTLFAHLVQPRDLDYWYRFDIDQLAHCDALYRLPGASSGADREVAYAVVNDIPVFDDRHILADWLELAA